MPVSVGVKNRRLYAQDGAVCKAERELFLEFEEIIFKEVFLVTNINRGLVKSKIRAVYVCLINTFNYRLGF